MKKIVIIIMYSLVCCVHAEDKLTFVAFEINSEESLAEYDALYKTTSGHLSALEYSKLTNIVDKIYCEELEIDGTSVSVDKKCPVQFAKKEGDKYVLAPSDLMQGVKCELEIEVIPSVGFLFNGSAEFLSHQGERYSLLFQILMQDVQLILWGDILIIIVCFPVINTQLYVVQ